MNLLIRTDASEHIGTGHVMRCLALAQAAQDAGQPVTFALALTTPAIQARLRDERCDVLNLPVEPGSQEDSNQTIAAARRLDAPWIILDGYHFGAEYQQRVKSAGLSLLLLDDLGQAWPYSADFILNQNSYAREAGYARRAPHTRLLLGTRYVLLRREFRQGWQRERPAPPIGRKILVTLGGSDPENVTAVVMEALSHLEIDCEVMVIVGGSNPHVAQLQAHESPHPIHVKTNVTDMPALMAWADIAIAGGGTTVWELAFMGVPALLITLADNQRESVNDVVALDIAVSLGWHSDLSQQAMVEAVSHLLTSADLRASMSQYGQMLVDGLGAERVLSQIQGERVFLRTITQNDCQRIWQWANEPVARAMSLSSDTIPWETHVKWFASMLARSDSLFLIGEDVDANPVGQVRYAISGQEAVVSISIAADFRGNGYGRDLLKLSAKRLFEQRDANQIHAYIKPENQVSQQVFLSAGYELIGVTDIRGHEVVEYVFKRQLH